MPTFEGEQKTEYERAIKTTTEPLTDDLRLIVARFDTALRELHRPRAVAACDWNLDYDAGPELLLPHLQKARDLSRAALLRARLRFAAGAVAEAVADVVAVLKMACDCGVSPVLISLLVDIAMENMATKVLAANLPNLSPRCRSKSAVQRSVPRPLFRSEPDSGKRRASRVPGGLQFWRTAFKIPVSCYLFIKQLTPAGAEQWIGIIRFCSSRPRTEPRGSMSSFAP